MAPTPVLLPGKLHRRRSLVGCSPWGREESDRSERLHFHFSLSCIGEGDGNPLQCSCLENPRDGGAWWAAVYGVAESDMTEAIQQQLQQQQCVYSILISQFVSPYPFLPVSTSVLCIWVSVPTLQIGSSEPFFQSPHICNNICFSLPDLLHTV